MTHPGSRCAPRGAAALTAAAALLATAASGLPAQRRPNAIPQPPEAGPVSPWPRPIPIRLEPEQPDELLVTTLGNVTTPLADGTFDPVADRVTTRDGRVIEHYYRDSLHIPFYAPLDKSHFPLPPSGWCTWYYYYRVITPDEVLANAHWIARHLAPYGARYVQLDDGWQGHGPPGAGPRDWSTLDPRFRSIGLAGLADSIRALGLEPGIWIAPHGQSNETVARRAGVFLWKPDGSSASSTWEGTYLLDPTAPAMRDYLHSLFAPLRRAGYRYFKIDGQTGVLREYATKTSYMTGPVPNGPRDSVSAVLYRNTLRAIREAIGPDSYLLASWGTPLAGMGWYNGSRTGGDIVLGWDGFLGAMAAIQRWNFLHNIAWYSDPDVLLVRPPMSDGTVRAWATALGLTGQALMSSDRLTDLPEERVELLRRVYPAVDIRPLDLYRPANARKPIIDLKVNHLGRTYDVVGIFNYDTDRSANRHLAWRALGLDSTAAYHVFDFWNGTYYGAWHDGVFIDVPPADVRVLTLVRATDRPVLVSTSRHITQGWVDLLALDSGGTATRPTLAGRSRVVGGDPYTLTIGLPAANPTLRLAAVHVEPDRGGAPVEVSWASHQGYATVTMRSPDTRTITWRLEFAPDTPYVYPVTSPNRIRVTPVGLSGATVRWPVEYYPRAAYRVEVDGVPRGVAFEARADLEGLTPGRSYRIAARSLWSDGSAAKTAAEITYTPAIPDSVFLADLEPAGMRQDWERLGVNRTVEGAPLTVAGTAYSRGIGTLAGAELHYELLGLFTRLTTKVGIDDEERRTSPVHAIFEIWGDGRLLARSDTVTSGRPAVPLTADVRGVRQLTLKVVPVVMPGTDRGEAAHADWLEALLEGGHPHP
jgi:hypothetical protein